jgi:hypothetical protein
MFITISVIFAAVTVSGGSYWFLYRHFHRQLMQLKNRLDQVNQEYYHQQQQTEAAEREIQSLIEQSRVNTEAYHHQLQDISRQNEAYQQQIEQIESLLAIANQRQRELTTQLETQQEAYHSQAETLHQQLEQAQKTLLEHTQQAEQTLEQLRQEREIALQAQQAMMQAQINHLLQEKQELSQAMEDLYVSIEDSIQSQTQELEKRNQALLLSNQQLQQDNAQLHQENETLKHQLFLSRQDSNPGKSLGKKFSTSENAVILMSTEQDLYPEEKRSLILHLLRSERDRIEKQKRRIHIIDDILANNSMNSSRDEFEFRLKKVLSSYREMDSKTRGELQHLGFAITDDGKHYKLIFQQDDRYTFACPKSGSDHRGGKNLFSWIRGLLL